MNQHVAIRAETEPKAPDFTHRDFVRMMKLGAFEGMRVELADGRLLKMSPAGPGHGRANFSIGYKLASLGADTSKRIGTDIAIICPRAIRAADVCLLRDPLVGFDPVAGSEVELAVEVSGGTLGRDLGRKALDYAQAGVPVYWVVDLDGEVTHVFTDPADNGYRHRAVVRFNEPLSLPGYSQSIALA
jgi:Uma2 family endonuclease